MVPNDDATQEPVAPPVPATSPYQDEVNKIRRRDDAAFVAIVAIKDGAISATFSDPPFDLLVVAVAMRTIADALEAQHKKAKAAAELVLKHDG